MRIGIVIACGALACGKGDDRQRDPKAADPPPQPALGTLEVTIDGEPVRMQRAFVKRLPGERFQVYATTAGGACRELLENVFDERRDERSILVTVGPRLRPDGTRVMVVTDAYGQGAGEVAPGASAAVAGTADAGAITEVTLAYAAVVASAKYEVAGRFPAEGCGERSGGPTKGRPSASHASTATITIAGVQLPLRGAIRRGDRILLSTSVKDCSPVTPEAQAVLRHEYGRWELTGLWFETASRATDRGVTDDTMKDIAITAGTTGTSDDGPTVTLTLAGEGKMGAYPIVLAGTIEALDCPAD